MNVVGEKLNQFNMMSSSTENTTGSAFLSLTPVKKMRSKKASRVNLIQRELRRTINERNFIHLTPSKLLKRFENDVKSSKLYVRGSKLEPFEFSLEDVTSLINHLELKVHESHCAKKLKDSPLFSLGERYITPEKQLHLGSLDDYPYACETGDHLSFIDRLVKKSTDFSRSQRYQYSPVMSFDVYSSYMHIIFLSLERLTTNSTNSFLKFLHRELSDYKYRHLSPLGVYIALLHIQVRGIASLKDLRQYTKWQDTWNLLTLSERHQLLQDFYQGSDTNQLRALQESQINQLSEFFSIIRHEAMLIRYSYRIAENLFDPSFIYYTTWYNSTVRAMSATELYRSERNLPISHLLWGNPTMFKTVINPVVQPAAEAFAEAIPGALKDALKDEETKNLLRETVTESLKPTVENLQTSADSFSERTLNQIQSTIKPITDQMMGFFTGLTGMSQFFESLRDQIKSVFPDDIFGRKIPINFEIPTIIELIKYYILYINLDNKLLKASIVALMLRQIGLLPYVMKWGEQIFKWTFSNATDLVKSAMSGDPTVKAEPTSSDWFTAIIETIMEFKNEIGVCTIFTTLLAFMYNQVQGHNQALAKGLRYTEFTSISSIVVGMMKNCHWIGSGLFGLDRIFKYSIIVSKSLTKWVRERVYNITDEARATELLISKWIVLVKYFSTDNGRNVIRVSQSARLRASSLHSEGLAFMSIYGKDNTAFSKDTYNLIHRLWKDVNSISNYVSRLEATSKFQPAMFHIQFVGEPGIGKSTLTDHVIKRLSAKIYPADKRVTHWTYNPNSDHFDGYNSQDIMIIDDLFRYNEPKHLSLIIGLITNTPVPLPMAHLEDKGTHLNSDILLSSTNIPYPIGKDIYCMEAVHRRRHILCEVKMDPRVKVNGQFDLAKFNQYYPGQNSHDFPHLNFNLMKSVRYGAEELYQTTNADEMEVKYNLIKELKKANQSLKFSEDFYFGPDARPPSDMQVPCVNWNFDTFIENVAVHYKRLRHTEGMLTRKEKYAHIAACFDDIDLLFTPGSHIKGGEDVSKTHKLIADQFLDMSYEYGIEDPLGERIYYEPTTVPDDLDHVDLEQVVGEIVTETEAQPTSNVSEVRPGEHLSEYCERISKVLHNYKENYSYSTQTAAHIEDLLQRLAFMPRQESLQDFTEDDHILIDQITRDIKLDEDEFRATPESSRRHRILAKRGKVLVDPVEKDALKVTRYDNRSYIVVSSPFTQWDGLTDSRTFPGAKFQEAGRSLSAYKSCLDDFVKFNYITKHDAQGVCEFVGKMHNSPKFVFPRKIAGREQTYLFDKNEHLNSQIPIEFLRRLKYIKSEWHLDVTDLDFYERSTLKIQHGRKEYDVKADVAFLLSLTYTTSIMFNSFAMLTTDQQQYCVRESIWQYQFMRRLNLDALKEDLRTVTRHVRSINMPYLFRPLQMVWTVLRDYWPALIMVIYLFAFISFFKQMSLLFNPKKEDTSKFMHRAQVSGIRFHGKPTSLFTPRNVDESLAQSYLARNVKFLTIRNEFGVEVEAHAIHNQQFLILNAHTAQFINNVAEIYYKPSDNSEQAWVITVRKEDIYIKPKTDLAIIYNRCLPNAKDISSHFITQDDFDHIEHCGPLWSLTKFQNQTLVEVRDQCAPYKNITLHGDAGETGHLDNAIVVEGSTVLGKSGSMLVIPGKCSGNRNIVGIQAWRITDMHRSTICYQVCTKEDYENLTTNVMSLQTMPIITQLGPVVCEPTASKNIDIFDSHIDPVGSVPSTKVVGLVSKTKFTRTPLALVMDKEGLTSPRVPAALSVRDPRLFVKDHPLKHSVNKYGRGCVGPFCPDTLRQATHDLAYWLRDKLDKKTFNTNLTLEECVEGLRIPGSNPIDCRASPGIPYIWEKYPGKPPGKKAYFSINDEGKCIVHDKSYYQQFEKTFSLLSAGIIPHHTSYDFPKDELRPISKALGDPVANTPPKTRSVTCMSQDFILSWRRVTLDLFSSLHRAARGDFPFGPGINPEGPDWTNLYHYLNKHPHCLDFDVSNWDGHMPPDLLFSAGDILCILLNVKSNSKEGKVIYSLLTEVLFGHIQFEDAVYQKFRGLISGFPGTAEMNTLVHILLVYYFYLYICHMYHKFNYANIYTFFNLVSVVCYGDDVILSFSDEIIEWFNGKEIARMYEEHGYPVTTASKSGDIPYTKPLLECQFLKSGFNVINSMRVDRTMDISVVYDLFYWVRAGEHPYDQFRSNMHDAFRILHGHGDRTYEEVRSKVNLWLSQKKLEPFSLRWSDFEKIHIANYFS